jgi:hypothetical protein
MYKRWLINVILLIIVVILGLLIFYTLERNKPIEQAKLTGLDAKTVQSIRIERSGKQPITLLKEISDSWQLTAPFELPANNFQIKNLLQILSLREYKKIASTNLAEFKLDTPLATIQYNQLTMAFGDSSPINHQRYVQINNVVYLIRDTWYYYLIGDALAFASLNLLGNNSKIIELEMPGHHLKLQDTKWSLESDFENIDTSADTLNSLIDNWQHASAYDVKPYIATEDTTVKEQIKITLLGQPKPLHFIIVSKAPDLVLAIPEKKVQYQLSGTQNDKLLQVPMKPQD